MRTGITYLLALFIATPYAYAIYETPISTDGCRIEPYALGMDMTVLDSLQSVCKKQGYWIVPLIETEYDHVTLDDFVWHLTYSTGIFGIASHGSSAGPAVEVFAEEAQRDSAYDYYLAHGYDSFEIYKSDAATPQGRMYHIGAMSLLISRCFESNESIVYNATCHSHDYWAAWDGAREVIGYSGSPTFGQMRGDAEFFWSRLNGYEGKASRYVDGALGGLLLSHWGNGNTVLSPTVDEFYPPKDTIVGSTGIDGWIRFDTGMDTNINPEQILKADDTVFSLEDINWGTDGDYDIINFHIKAVGPGPGYLSVDAYSAISQGGIPLDGNRNPPGTDGVGPNGDDYGIRYDSDIAARYGSMWAYRDGSDVKVGWHVEAEVGTWGYEVQGFEGGTWHKLAQLKKGEAVVPSLYEITVPGGYSLYRVVEIEATGARLPAMPIEVLMEEPPIAKVAKKILPGYYQNLRLKPRQPAQCRQSRRLTRSTHVPDWIFYGPDSLIAACMPAVGYLESQGLEVDTIYATSSYH